METDISGNNNYLLTFNKIDSLLSNRECRKVEIFSLNVTVDEVANSISQLWKIDKSCFDITCFGNILDGSKTLSFYGITNGTLVYLINKKEPPLSLDETIDDKNDKGRHIYEKCKALETTLLNPLFRQELNNLASFSKRENLVNVNPEVRDDPSILGVFSDADLLSVYLHKNNIKTVLKRYPHFLEVATNVSATFLEEMNSTNSSTNLAYRGNVVNYSIDNDDDDDDMDDSDASSVSSANTNNSRSRAPSTSNPESLSSMLMQAYNRRQLNVITHDMLRSALTQTANNLNVPNVSGTQPSASTSRSSLAPTPLSGVSPSSSSSSVPNTSSNRTVNATANALINLAPQLAQMRELGITDEIVAIQALEATSGDVQAAINIIFSDFN